MKPLEKQLALVTGGNKGIGFEVCRQLAKKKIQVILTSRNEEKGHLAVKKLAEEGLEVHFHPLDVAKQEDVDRITQFVVQKWGRLDILINNAGIMLDQNSSTPEGDGASIFKTKIDTIRQSMETNTYGPIRMIQKFAPLMKKNGYGRIVNLSSGMAQLSEMNGGWPGYRLSKVSLNAVTRIVADELEGSPILINSVCPGWVKTDMGGPQAEISTEEASDTILWLATLPDNGPTGGFFRERQQIPW